MKFAAAIFCLLLSLAAFLLAIDASGSLQDAPPLAERTRWTLPYVAAGAAFGVASIVLFVNRARRGL